MTRPLRLAAACGLLLLIAACARPEAGMRIGAAPGDGLAAQQEALEAGLAGVGATVVRTGDGLLVTLPNNVAFDFDRAEIRPEFDQPLDRMAETLIANPRSTIDILGHTDSRGSEEYNQALSERRALAVAQALAARGVRRDRLNPVGFGESRPIATNETDAGRAANRRVEIRITPIT